MESVGSESEAHYEGQKHGVRVGEGRAALLDGVVEKASWRGQGPGSPEPASVHVHGRLHTRDICGNHTPPGAVLEVDENVPA